jgi:tetratricopeptide (TPR) repeat protein
MAEARELYEALRERYPGRKEVLGPLMNIYLAAGDMPRFQTVCQELVALRPDDPDLVLSLAGAYLSNVRPALALQTFQSFLSRWSDHEEAARVRQTVADLEGELARQSEYLGVAGGDAQELLVLHEDLQSHMFRGDFAGTIQRAEKLLERLPDFVPARNNLTTALFHAGRPEEAIAMARRVLERDPENVHALGNLTEYLLLTGKPGEARAAADRLRNVAITNPDLALKKAEVFSFVGDHQAVLDALAARDAAEPGEPLSSEAPLYHLAAVAAHRLDRAAEARGLWQWALRLQPGFTIARENLDDLAKPAGQRHAPWPFMFSRWMSQRDIEALRESIHRTGRRAGEDAAIAALREFLAAHPALASLVPTLLDRGDPVARDFALRMARSVRTPELLVALRDFALSDRGPDELRTQASQTASQAGLMPDGPVRMWVQGEWREIQLFKYEIHGEAESPLTGRANELALKAFDALNRGDGVRAEGFVREALELAPDSPSLHNNLGLALQLQGRIDETEALMKETFERFPDYLFVRVSMARLALRERDVPRAKELLAPLIRRRKFHLSEFAALASAQIDLLLAEGQPDGARTWLDLWERFYPDHHLFDQYRRLLREAWRSSPVRP